MAITDTEALKLASQITTKIVRPLEHVAELVEYINGSKRQVQEYEARIPLLKREVEQAIEEKNAAIQRARAEEESVLEELNRDHIKRKQDLEKEYVERRNALAQDFAKRKDVQENQMKTFEAEMNIKRDVLGRQLNEIQVALNGAKAREVNLNREIEKKAAEFQSAEIEMTEKIKRLNIEYAKLKDDYERFLSTVTRRPNGS